MKSTRTLDVFRLNNYGQVVTLFAIEGSGIQAVRHHVNPKSDAKTLPLTSFLFPRWHHVTRSNLQSCIHTSKRVLEQPFILYSRWPYSTYALFHDDLVLAGKLYTSSLPKWDIFEPSVKVRKCSTLALHFSLRRVL